MKKYGLLSIIALACLICTTLSANDEIFSYPQDKKVILTQKHIDHTYGRYLSDIEISIQANNELEPKLIWNKKFKNPFYSGFGGGGLQSLGVYSDSKCFYLFLTTMAAFEASILEVIKVDTNDNFKLTESSFIICLQMAYLKMDSFAYGDDIIIKFSDSRNEERRPNIYLFDTKSDNVFLLFSSQQLIYRNLPVELALLIKSPQGLSPQETSKASSPRSCRQ